MPPMTHVYTGSNGTLVLGDANTPEGKDAAAVLDFFEARTVARVTGVKIAVRTDLQEYHEIGRRLPTSLHPGDVHISGEFTRAYVNGALLCLLMGRGASPNTVPEPYVQPTFILNVQLDDPAVPTEGQIVELLGVKLQDWGLVMPEEDFVMENVTFRALSISSYAVPAGGGDPLIPAFP